MSAPLQDNSKHDVWRDDAAEALGELNPNPIIEDVLLTFLHDETLDKQIRIGAAKALGELGHTETAISYLASVIEHPVSSFGSERYNIINRLGKLSQGESEVLEQLCNLIRDDQVNDFEKDRVYRVLKQLVSKRDLSQTRRK